VIQALFLASAAGFVGFSALRIGPIAAVGSVVGILVCVPLFAFSGYILSEAVFGALILFNVGLAIRLIDRFRSIDAALLAATAVAIFFVRPAGYFAPLGIIFLFLVRREHTRHLLKWCVLPFVLFAAATFLINQSVRGSTSPSQTGRVLFAHIAPLFDPAGVPENLQEYAQAAERGLAKYRADFKALQDERGRFDFLLNTYNAQIGAIESELQPLLAGDPSLQGYSQFVALDKVQLRLFLATITNRPMQYVGFVVTHLIDGWHFSAFNSWRTQSYRDLRERDFGYSERERAELIRDYRLPLSLADVSPSMDALEGLPKWYVGATEFLYNSWSEQRWLIYSIGLATLFSIFTAPFLPSRCLAALGYCGVMLHTSFGLTAATTVFIARYDVPLEPMLFVASALVAEALVMLVTRLADKMRRNTAIAEQLHH
jgi:hypothetical protein